MVGAGEAALLGENTYNFGELVRAICLHPSAAWADLHRCACWTVQLQHPIIKALNGTQYEWLSNLLFAFNAGDLAKFNAILKQEGKQVHRQLNVFRSGSPRMCTGGAVEQVQRHLLEFEDSHYGVHGHGDSQSSSRASAVCVLMHACVLSLVSFVWLCQVFRKDANERTISFKEVASFCDVKEGEVGAVSCASV